MKTLGNILWLILGGIINGVISYIVGAFLCITIIGIPVGLQFFKLGKFFFWPMGKTVKSVNVTGFKTFLNVLWAIFAGWEYAISNFIVGIIFCITIIGIPFGKQCFKMIKLSFIPFGAEVQ